MPIMTVNNLNHHYKDGDYRRFVLKEVNCSFEKDSTLFLANQARENYFLSLLGAMDTVQEGIIEYNGQPYQKREARMQLKLYRHVFQSYNLVPT